MGVTRIPATSAAMSLFWDGDGLVDVVGGWRRWDADGAETSGRVGWGYPFDQAVVSPSGRFQVIYAERGTKAVVLADGRIVRELNRSFSHATDYDYPVALGRLPDGREILVHCPDQYNVLEIEDLETGRRLAAGERRPADVFHSRLAVSPDGRHLLMAGWLWHPYGVGWVFDLQQALADPSVLDGRGIVPLYDAVDAEIAAACWLDDDRVVMAASAEESLDGGHSGTLSPGQLGVWSIAAGAWQHRATVAHPLGTMITRGNQILALHGHPRLIGPARWFRARRMARRGRQYQERKLRRHPSTHAGRRSAPGSATDRGRTIRPHRRHPPADRMRTAPPRHQCRKDPTSTSTGQRQTHGQRHERIPPSPFARPRLAFVSFLAVCINRGLQAQPGRINVLGRGHRL